MGKKNKGTYYKYGDNAHRGSGSKPPKGQLVGGKKKGGKKSGY